MFISHIGIVASSREEELLPFTFWDMTGTPGGALTNVNIQYNQPSVNVQIDWGDGSAPEDITSGVSYNHTFI